MSNAADRSPPLRPSDATAPAATPAQSDSSGSDITGSLPGLSSHDSPTRAVSSSTGVAGAGQPTFVAGDVAAERYRIVRFIAQGGMGEVYEAEDLHLREHVALKTVRAHIAAEPLALERFKREIHLARRVTHPNVCRIFEFGIHREGGGSGVLPAGDPTPTVAFLTMELLAGETLSARLRRAGTLSPTEALPLVAQMTAALGAAHRAGIVHRDFKSANVVLVPDSEAEGGVRAVVTDFGLARGDATDDKSVTGSDAIVGTPDYMAPEQVEGAPVTPAADIYALGVVLFEMVTGAKPFVGASALTTAVKRLKEPAPSPRVHAPDLEAKWVSTIMRCLERAPGDRFAKAADVLAALGGQPVSLGDRQRKQRGWVGAAAVFAAVAVIAVIAWRGRMTPPPPSAATAPGTTNAPAAAAAAPRRSVAVLGFKNLSGKPAAAWLSTALSEVLTSELAAGERLRTIAGENVARMKVELALGESESLARDTLARIGSNLGTDYVVLGSYLLVSGGEGRLRLDVRLQETGAGETLVSVTETGREADLLDLVSRTGTRLRDRLGAQVAPSEAVSSRAALPQKPEAARFYSEGLAKLRLFDALAARDLLQRAVDADPSAPLPHSALAAAWDALGYDVRARDEARKAFETSSELPREDRMLVAARHHEAAARWDEAIKAYQSLWSFFPDNLDYGLRLAEVQNAAGQAKASLSTIESLRQLPKPASNDPRIDLAEAQGAETVSDYRRAQQRAAAAAAKGTKLGARTLVAQARFQESRAFWRLGDPAAATARAEEAQRIFTELGDRAGAARSLNVRASVQGGQGDLDGAEAAYRQALAIAREVGDRSLTRRLLSNIAVVQGQRGELTSARALFEESLQIARETGDRLGVAALLHNLGAVHRLQGDLPKARAGFEESLVIAREVGEKGGIATKLNEIANVLLQQGDLDGAQRAYAESLGLQQEIGNRSEAAGSSHGLGDLALARGDLEGARTRYQETLDARTALGEKGGIAEARLALARVAIESGEAATAVAAARDAASEFAAQKRTDDEAGAHSLLATALLASGQMPAAREAMAACTRLLGRSANAAAQVSGAIVGARVRAAAGETGPAIEALTAAKARASRAGFALLEGEADLALGQAEIAAGRTAAGRERLTTLAKTSGSRGLRLLERKAEAALR